MGHDCYLLNIDDGQDVKDPQVLFDYQKWDNTSLRICHKSVVWVKVGFPSVA